MFYIPFPIALFPPATRRKLTIGLYCCVPFLLVCVAKACRAESIVTLGDRELILLAIFVL